MTDVVADQFSPEPDRDSGSFLTGFTIGLFAGAAGYFLFGTDRGGKVRSELMEEWENAKEHLMQKGVLDNPQASIRDLIKDTVEEVVRKVGLVENSVNRASSTSKSKVKAKSGGGASTNAARAQEKDKAGRKFRGV